MTFKPLAQRYVFDDSLSMEIDSHVKESLANWIQSVLKDNEYFVEGHWTNNSPAHITTGFKEFLQIRLREVYPQTWGSFIEFIMNDRDRTLTLLQICLSRFARQRDADKLEWVLRNSGSGYAVTRTKKNASEYDQGGYDLVERVPAVVIKISDAALSSNDELMKAWVACYGVKPNYNESIGACQNVLEEMLRDNYLPNDIKVQLGKLIKDIRAGKKLDFTGSGILKDSNIMLDLIESIPAYRGLHKAGTGKDATKDIAEYALHTTIYLWNLHRVKEAI